MNISPQSTRRTQSWSCKTRFSVFSVFSVVKSVVK